MAQKKEFLAIIPDKPGALQKRLEVRPTHLANLKPLIENGTIVAGGAMFNDRHPEEGETPAFKGSMAIYQAESIEEVRNLLSQDVYAREGVWDLEATTIVPFRSAVRQPL
ncbi:hypothetical protein VTN49DRAFT_2956 [Thermomyces lanuginosus]|uniref:uncharacterized protein n=1 Tax=Thermomyces lanuginosus TaxID=5541 RepID=UPI003743F622